MEDKEILIIEDDVAIGDLLEKVLKKQSCLVLRAYSGTEALLVLQSRRPDLVLLDLMLPGLCGEEVLPQIGEIPVIVLSAKAGVEDKVKLLLGGAADYMTKPFELQELLARITVQLRGKAREKAASGLQFRDLSLDTATHEVKIQKETVRLTRTEYAILKCLMQNPAQAIPKSLLLERLGEETPDCTESSLKVHVSNLRRKLSGAGGADYIESVWGIGFKMKDTP